jgi:hypothetical protein
MTRLLAGRGTHRVGHSSSVALITLAECRYISRQARARPQLVSWHLQGDQPQRPQLPTKQHRLRLPWNGLDVVWLARVQRWLSVIGKHQSRPIHHCY